MENAAQAARIGGLSNQKYFEDLEEKNFNELVSFLLDYIKTGDFLFVKGSHGMHLETIIKKICVEEE